MSAAVIVLLAGAIALVLLAIIAQRDSSDLPDAEHPNWKNDRPAVDLEKIAGLNEYPGTFSFEIVGESHYQGAIEKVCGGKTDEAKRFETPALLVPYRNQYDPLAVAVLMGDCQIVGHLSRVDARKLRIAMKKIGLGGCSLKVPAIVVGGWKRQDSEGHFGVKLDLPC